jgi:hypothetical protein
MQTPRGSLQGALHAELTFRLHRCNRHRATGILPCTASLSTLVAACQHRQPPETRKSRGGRLPDSHNSDMAVPGCGEFCRPDRERTFDPPLTPDRARDSCDTTNRRAGRLSCRWASGSRYEHRRYSRSDPERVPPIIRRRVSESEAMRTVIQTVRNSQMNQSLTCAPAHSRVYRHMGVTSPEAS